MSPPPPSPSLSVSPSLPVSPPPRRCRCRSHQPPPPVSCCNSPASHTAVPDHPRLSPPRPRPSSLAFVSPPSLSSPPRYTPRRPCRTLGPHLSCRTRWPLVSRCVDPSPIVLAPAESPSRRRAARPHQSPVHAKPSQTLTVATHQSVLCRRYSPAGHSSHPVPQSVLCPRHSPAGPLPSPLPSRSSALATRQPVTRLTQLAHRPSPPRARVVSLLSSLSHRQDTLRRRRRLTSFASRRHPTPLLYRASQGSLQYQQSGSPLSIRSHPDPSLLAFHPAPPESSATRLPTGTSTPLNPICVNSAGRTRQQEIAR